MSEFIPPKNRQERRLLRIKYLGLMGNRVRQLKLSKWLLGVMPSGTVHAVVDLTRPLVPQVHLYCGGKGVGSTIAHSNKKLYTERRFLMIATVNERGVSFKRVTSLSEEAHFCLDRHMGTFPLRTVFPAADAYSILRHMFLDYTQPTVKRVLRTKRSK